MVHLHLDRLPPGRSELAIDDVLVREDQVLVGRRVEGFEAHVSGCLTVDNLDQKVLVYGEFRARREMLCDRSGEPFELEYPVAIEVLVHRQPGRGGDEEVGEDDSWIIHQPGGVVDLTEAFLEAVVLDEPQHVVHPDHRDDPLPALGPKDEEEIDPRWEALRKLRTGADSAE